ncbi:Conserved oligomeric Golgi complex subunit 4 [Nymphon striatum]|nr:Conserved oligomeric Golgi complex subunit 4 [Nymphon striatum]
MDRDLEDMPSDSSIDDIKKLYEDLCRKEDEVNSELIGLMGQNEHLQAKVQSLNRILPNLQLLHTDSEQLSGMVSFTSTLAENVSSKVRQLDLAKNRVTECLQRVEDILDLKFCTDGVQTALQNEDYEKAAALVHRFLCLDESVFKLSSQDNGEDTNLNSSYSMLHEAEQKLKSLVTHKFDEAVKDEDLASVERFFKIFPLLNQHSEGLKKFSLFLSMQIVETSQKNIQLALTTKPDDKRADVIYADTLTLLFEGIARIVEIHQPLIETYYGPGRMMSVNFCSPKRIIDPRELDVLLTESTLLNARTELYLRFINRRLTSDIEVACQDAKTKEEKLLELRNMIKECELNKRMQEVLGTYILMEEYFMRESVNKAISLDISDEGMLTSSMVDDIFYLLKKCLRRAMTSASVDGVCAILNHARTELESDYWDILNSQIKQGFPSGMLDLTQAYNTTLNNIEASAEHIQTLKSNVQSEISHLSHINDQEKAKLEVSGLTDLSDVSSKYRSLLECGLLSMMTSALKPRIKPWIEALSSTSYTISEDEFSNYEANDPFVQNLIVNINNLITSFKESLTPGNYDSLIGFITSEVARQLEKVVLKISFNRLGGLQIDKDLRALVSYLTSVTTWTIRDKFARLTQISTILNLEKVSEISDYWGQNSGSLTWRLTPSEVRQVMRLRIDFKPEEIRRIKL